MCIRDRHTGDPPFKSEEDALNLIINYPDYKVHGYGRWICELKETGEPIGWAGLKNQLDDVGIIDIGYRFLQQYWNKGYGFEAAEGCLKYGFEVLKMEKITGRAAIENVHSHSILKRIGLKAEEEKRDCHGIKAIYYSLTLKKYQKITR